MSYPDIRMSEQAGALNAGGNNTIGCAEMAWPSGISSV